MKQFLGFVRKEIYHIFRDYRTLLILFGMPIVQLVLFGFALRNEVNNAQIAILDYSRDYMTQEITNKLLSSGFFELAATIHSEKEIEPTFQKGKVREVIIFQREFARSLSRDGKASVRVVADATDPNVSNILISYTTNIIQNYQQSLSSGRSGVQIQPEIAMFYNSEMKSVYMFVPGLIALILMLVSALMTSITITREKELGTMEVLLVSPLRPLQIIIGKVLPYMVLAFTNVITVLLLARLVFGVPFRGNLVLFLLESMLFIFTALSLGILISTRSDTQQAAMMISLSGLLMPTTLLSGFVFPVDNMPFVLQIISNIIPAKWFLIIEKGIMLKGVGIEHLWKETLILFGMMTFFLVVSLRNFKVRLQ